MKNDQRRKFIVDETTRGLRLDKFLQSQISEISRNRARKLIASECVLLNEKVCKIHSRQLKLGNRVLVQEPPLNIEQKNSEFILWEDKYFIVVNKPIGVICEDAKYSKRHTIIALLQEENPLPGKQRYYVVHRLDANTSGVLLLAKRPCAAKAMYEQFRERRVRKTYLAIVKAGFPEHMVCDGAIARVAPGASKHGVRAQGKSAYTEFYRIQQTISAALIRAEPKTGRTHQIRVHAAEAGYPLLGDKLYAGIRSVRGLDEQIILVNRTMLHAHTLHFKHPISNEKLSFQAGLAQDMYSCCNALGLSVDSYG